MVSRRRLSDEVLDNADFKHHRPNVLKGTGARTNYFLCPTILVRGDVTAGREEEMPIGAVGEVLCAAIQRGR
jgi:hypothetical protein